MKSGGRGGQYNDEFLTLFVVLRKYQAHFFQLSRGSSLCFSVKK